MKAAQFRNFAVVVSALGTAALSTSCESTNTARRLPAYEAPIAKSNFQTVHTTAYTHTESDHLEYTNHNALGGELHAAGPPIRRVELRSPKLSLGLEAGSYRLGSVSSVPQPFSMGDDEETPPRAKAVTRIAARVATPGRGTRRTIALPFAPPPKIGSAAADWSRWPAGTTFRLLSTGQIYRVDDYGWALAGRNTIDLYMATPRDMNSWGAREEQIQVIEWGDAEESLRCLQSHQGYKHIRRMVMELQGRQQEAATMQ